MSLGKFHRETVSKKKGISFDIASYVWIKGLWYKQTQVTKNSILFLVVFSCSHRFMHNPIVSERLPLETDIGRCRDL